MSSPPMSRDALRDELLKELAYCVGSGWCGEVWFETDDAEQLIRKYEETFVSSSPQPQDNKEDIPVTEVIDLKNTAAAPAPEGPVKGKDGYYHIQVEKQIGNENIQGIMVAIVKLNTLPENLDVNDPKSVDLTFTHQRSDQIGFPDIGQSSSGTVVSVDTNQEALVINVAIDNIDELRNWHLDHVAFIQMRFPRNGEIFSAYRPGEKIFISLDLAHSYTKGAAKAEAVADAPAVTDPAPTAGEDKIESHYDVAPVPSEQEASALAAEVLTPVDPAPEAQAEAPQNS